MNSHFFQIKKPDIKNSLSDTKQVFFPKFFIEKNKTKDTMKLSNFDTITVIRYTRQIVFFRFEKYFNLEVRVIKIDLFKMPNKCFNFKNIIIKKF